MPNITKQQIQKINEKCQNDWQFDVEYYLFHNQKTLIKQIKLDEEHYLEFALRYDYKNRISLHIGKFEHKPNAYFASSNGLGKSKILDETPATRKNLNVLIDITKTLNDEECLKINAETQVTKSPIFIASEEF